ncbi:amidohydrolase/deacetylase family metallohydrolase [Vagococcus xieshaowenii]|uniref:amidohydrolase/deacetylase family metallohydrolase n=1 Tax=Vagococcus xieshaowenii TaxID=2562451 RepID=UPI0014323176|nr:amidohydrolase/deacetylase family metallohydrolase [Vagococcus xieshaowenii]
MISKIINAEIVEEGIQGSEILIRDGYIVSELESDEIVDNIIDAQGHYVSSGFIDSHVHVFEHMALNGINADDIGIRMGVTDVIDAGSTGSSDFYEFNKVIETSQTNVHALINIAKKGLVANLHELRDMNDLSDREEIEETIAQYPNKIIGIKVRLSASVVGDNGVAPLVEAIKIASSLELPIMVHIGNPPPYLPDVFPLLRSGDIVTHAFHGKKDNTILTKEGDLIAEAKSAIDRGVLFDVGHGSASFGFEVFGRFIQKYGQYDFSTSTDLHVRNVDGPVYSLMITLSKLYSYNIPLNSLLKTVTSIPSKVFNMKNKGSLLPGNKADITIFSIDKHSITLQDSLGVERELFYLFNAQKTIINGEVVWENNG